MEASPAVQAIDQCDLIIEKCEHVPFDGEDFAKSIKEKAASIRKWIQENGKVTKNQQAALDNMESGVDRWLENQDEEDFE